MKDILNAAAKSSAGTFISLLSSAVAIKIIALFAGPSGVGLFSLLRQTQQTASIVGVMGGQATIVQIFSGKDMHERRVHTVAIFRTILVATALVCLAIVVAAPWVGPWIFGDLHNATTIFRLIAIPTALGSGTLFLSGLINSHRSVGTLSLVQISAGMSLAFFSYAAVMQPSGIGFVILLSSSGITGLAVAIYFCNKKKWLPPLKKGWWRFSRNDWTVEFVKIGSATLATGLMGTCSVLLVRALIIKFDGYASAGIFDAAWTLSMTYVMLILTSFSAYYLPTLGTYKGKPKERNSLIEQYFCFATFASIPLIAVVMLLRPWVVELLYSKEFVPAIHMMRWMLLGDFFKISSWAMAMPMLAYSDIRPYVISEFLWNFGLSLLAYFSLAMGGSIENIGIIFMILYVFYFLYTYFYCRNKFKLKINLNLFLIWGIGFLFLFSISCFSY